jgi:alpha-L-fucosidase 2
MLTFNGHNNAVNYHRELDLDTAVIAIRYKVGDVTYKREIFSTPIDQVIVMCISADKPGMINFTANFDAAQEKKDLEIVDDCLSLHVYGNNHYNNPGVLKCHSRLKSMVQVKFP